MDDKPTEVLLIEDNPGDARLIREMLAEARVPFRLDCADRLAAGLERLKMGDVDVILLDLELPDSQELATFRWVHAQAPRVPILVLTVLFDEDLGVTAVREGAQDYLVKGQVDTNLLVQAIRYAIERKRIEEREKQLRQQLLDALTFREKARFQMVLDSVADGIYVTDCNLCITHWNPSAQRITGWKASQVVGKPCGDCLNHTDDKGNPLCHTPRCPLEIALATQVPVASRRVTGHTSDGRVVSLSVSTAPVKDEVGNIIGIVQVFRDVSAEVELESMKSQLLSTVSHELRTPLASIKGYSTLLLDYDRRLRRDEKRQHLEAIDRATDRLTELIDHLLDMSRLEAGLLRLDMVPTNIPRLIQEAVAEGELRSPEHRIKAELKGELPVLKVDGRRIHQVLDNLLDNAVKYSGTGTEVMVRAETKARELEISVSDQGRGIPAAEIPRVFDRMYRLERRLTSDPGGLGLGLALCKALVEAHRGRIWLESREGKGTTVRFTLPLVTMEEAPDGKKPI